MTAHQQQKLMAVVVLLAVQVALSRSFTNTHYTFGR